jgi:hypothetical protein
VGFPIQYGHGDRGGASIAEVACERFRSGASKMTPEDTLLSVIIALAAS